MSDFSVTLEPITKIEDIPGRDKIVLATVRGWKCIVKKDEFKVGDIGVFFPPDSLLPDNDTRFEFMRSRYFRVKTMKMAGVISQGLLLPVTMFPEILDECDIAKLLNVSKYEKPEEAKLKIGGNAVGLFPANYRKTDQERVQNLSNIYHDLQAFSYEITEKLDGTSCTIILEKGKDIRVCSRNLELKEEDDNLYWKVAREMFPKEGFNRGFWDLNYADGVALQGEIIGPGVQGNKYRLDKNEFYLFDIYTPSQGYLSPIIRGVEWALGLPLGVKRVPVIWDGFKLPSSIDDLILMACDHGKASRVFGGTKMEGLVFKSEHHGSIGNKKITFMNEIISFKVINNEWLLENE